MSVDANAALKLVGQTIGGCKLLEIIGSGGMGAVYRAEQLSLGKQVAVKILGDEWAKDERHVESFLQEARLAARLEDEHIIQIYDVGTEGGKNFIVMQLARGEMLSSELKKGPLEPERALKLIEGIAKGLSVAHAQNIIHRDIKPGNLVIGDGDLIKILDFGLARLDDEGDKAQGQFMGSIAYMSLEQSEYMPVGPQTDIYALGITAYQCLAGQLPFRGGSTNNYDLLVRHHCEQPAAPSILRPELPLTLSRVVLKMIEKSAERRYKTVDDLLFDLKLIRRRQMPTVTDTWTARPLNPPTVELEGLNSTEVYREGLARQREQFRAGEPVTPLRELLPTMGVEYRNPENTLMPATFLQARVGDSRATLRDATSALADDGFTFDRFHVLERNDRLIVRVEDSKSLSLLEAQRLFDLLEALPLDGRAVGIALGPSFEALGQDIRWVVDAYNLLDRRGSKFSLIVGSMENHTTFVNLGIDSHIKLELELDSGSGSKRKPKVEAPDTPDVEVPPLSPASQALAEQIRALVESRELLEAMRAWKRLLASGISRPQEDALADVRKSLYDGLLALGEEAWNQDDADTATERFNMLIDLDPDRYEGHYYKGLALKSEGKLEYAQAFLTQAILAAPDEGELFYHRAIVRSRSGDTEGALRDLNMALTHNPRLASAYYNRARLHKRMGREDLMKRDLALFERLKGEADKVLPSAGGRAPKPADLRS